MKIQFDMSAAARCFSPRCGLATIALLMFVTQASFGAAAGRALLLISIDGLRPDYVLVLPWNLTAEIVAQMSWIREWGGRFVVPIPELRVVA